jgi:hypothetical protein
MAEALGLRIWQLSDERNQADALIWINATIDFFA